MYIKHLTIALTASAFLAGVTPSAAQSSDCLNDAAVQQAVQTGRILPLSEVLSRAGLPPNIKVLPPVKVCPNAAGLAYHVAVLEGQNARNLVLPAT